MTPTWDVEGEEEGCREGRNVKEKDFKAEDLRKDRAGKVF